jgi:predicted ATP-dependent endonuclease of OLD family
VIDEFRFIHTNDEHFGQRLANKLHIIRDESGQDGRNQFRDIEMFFLKNYNLQISLQVDKTKEDSSNNNKNYEIVFDYISYEVFHESTGSGILQLIELVTNIINSTNKIFIVDEPEIHLHPHIIRSLLEIFKKYSKYNQIINITHSPYLVNFDHLENLLLMRIEQGQSEICFIKEKLNHEISFFLTKMFHSDQKDFLFAESVLLVEGDTEYGCLPDFAQKIDRSFNNQNISIINVDGSIFGDFINLFENLKIPYTILCDNDVLSEFKVSIKYNGKSIKTSTLLLDLYKLDDLSHKEINLLSGMSKDRTKTIRTTALGQKKQGVIYNDKAIQQIKQILAGKNRKIIILSSDFEDIFKEEGYEKYLKEAYEKFKSKILIGKYLASKIDKPPKKIQQILDYVLSDNKKILFL